MKKILAILTISMFINSAYAGVCDYKPSRIISAGSGLIAGTGIALKSAGLYTMTTPAGVTMFGSTVSGAGPLLAGTTGTLASISAVILSPAVLITTGVIAVGSGLMEGGCYLAGE
jgi:hypothetical protein